MSSSEAITFFREAIYTALIIAAPMLAFGLVAGLLVSIFQAVTQVHEMTLTFIPKILAVVLALVLFLPWMVDKIMVFTTNAFQYMGRF